ncbi:uncharacterized transposon-derived protein F54H12.3 [Trichonephila clavipes]|nr:uncharacterized transposon-derived protein F54H12.3 [Trichonephila clavipes]
MIKKYGAIENAAIDNMFQCMDFLTAYKTFCEGPIENTLPSSLDVSLAAFYENPEVPNSFGGVEALHCSVKRKYSKKDVKHWLSQKDAYTLHKPVRHKFQRNQVFVNDIDRQFQADLVDMQSLAEFNKGLKDLQGEEIKGTYYEAELQKVVDSGFYPVENVIKQRKRRGITEYFVKFLGYPEKFNDSVTDIQKV